MIRPCDERDVDAIHAIINDAAQKYRGAIPADQWHDPYMPMPKLRAELDAGVAFSGWDTGSELAGIMGIQRVRDVTLIRHAYVRKDSQGQGIGGKLLDAFIASVDGPLLVGTWAAATWAIRFYERHGFRLVGDAERDQLLSSYWTVPPSQRDVSVVLRYR